MDRYNAFIFNLQFKRKISPPMFFLSLKGMKIGLLFVLAYNFLTGKMMIAGMAILFFYAIKSYIETRLSYKSKLSKSNKVDRDISLPIFSWLSDTRERYIRASGAAKALTSLEKKNEQELSDEVSAAAQENNTPKKGK